MSTALRAFKPGVKLGFISDLYTPGKQLTRGERYLGWSQVSTPSKPDATRSI